MKIQDRVERLIPNSKVEWNSDNLELIIYVEKGIDLDNTTNIVANELNKIGLLRAVEIIRVVSKE